eukprot:gene13687-19577_t
MSTAGSADGYWNQGGYSIVKQQMLKACQSFASPDCTNTASVESCVVSGINRYVTEHSPEVEESNTSAIQSTAPAPSATGLSPLGFLLASITLGLAPLLFLLSRRAKLGAKYLRPSPAEFAARLIPIAVSNGAAAPLTMSDSEPEDLANPIFMSTDTTLSTIGEVSFEFDSADDMKEKYLETSNSRPQDTAKSQDAPIHEDGVGLVSEWGLKAAHVQVVRSSKGPKSPRMLRIHGYDDSGKRFYIQISQTLLGTGCYGKVWKGLWSGQEVAVKQMEHSPAVAERVANEVAMMLRLKHKHVVCAYQYVNFTLVSRFKRNVTIMKKRKASDRNMSPMDLMALDSSAVTTYTSSASAAAVPRDESTEIRTLEEERSCSTWIVMELCNKGTLASAIKNGMFHLDGRPQIEPILVRLLDVTAGCSYMHSEGICHGDLKCSNVLLAESDTDPYNIIAKVADFGMSRALADNQSHLSTRTLGTVSHMAPELLKFGQLSTSVDIFAFGICAWEIFSGKPAYSGLLYAQIVERVVVEKLRPRWSSWVPDAFRSLVE